MGGDAGYFVIYTDIACAWSTVAIVRLLRARDELGLTGQVRELRWLFL
ncbi:hypothetical protein AB0M48_21735 [Lentzea sp. NPDC051208]